MAVETLLVCSKDGNVVPLNVVYGNEAEKIRKKRMFSTYFRQKTLNNITDLYNQYFRNSVAFNNIEAECLKSLDCDNTAFLSQELNGPISFVKQPENYYNGASVNSFPLHIAQKNNILHFDYRISDADVPALIKNLGYAIKPDDRECAVSYNPQKGIYEVPKRNLTCARVNAEKRTITWFRDHLTFPPEDYRELKNMIALFKAEQLNNPNLRPDDFTLGIADARKRSLWQFYVYESYNVKTGKLKLLHEMKHVKNAILGSGLRLKGSFRRPSVEDYYRLQVEDERSAYLSQVINAVNDYQKKGKPEDFSMFDGESNLLVEKLKSIPSQNRLAYVADLSHIVKYAFKSFAVNHEHAQNYVTQFAKNLEYYIDNAPLSVDADADRSEFKKIRRLFYHFEVYNPQTKKTEYANLSSYITPDYEITIAPEIFSNVIELKKFSLQKRLQEYRQKVASGEINPELVSQAKAVKRDKLSESQFVNEIDTLSIANFPDNNYSETNPELSETAPEWSREIRKYWQQFDGYREIANTKKEYTFNLKNGTVSYTAKNKANVSANAEYDVYKKLVAEPVNKNLRVRFKDTLTEEQALKLYVACVISGRKMSGNIPADLHKIQQLNDIPSADLKKFNSILNADKPNLNQQNNLQQRQAASCNVLNRRSGVGRV